MRAVETLIIPVPSFDSKLMIEFYLRSVASVTITSITID